MYMFQAILSKSKTFGSFFIRPKNLCIKTRFQHCMKDQEQLKNHCTNWNKYKYMKNKRKITINVMNIFSQLR
jgi:hypothetical protein